MPASAAWASTRPRETGVAAPCNRSERIVWSTCNEVIAASRSPASPLRATSVKMYGGTIWQKQCERWVFGSICPSCVSASRQYARGGPECGDQSRVEATCCIAAGCSAVLSSFQAGVGPADTPLFVKLRPTTTPDPATSRVTNYLSRPDGSAGAADEDAAVDQRPDPRGVPAQDGGEHLGVVLAQQRRGQS